MLLSLLLLVLLFALTIFQSKHGLYSAFLMAVLTLCCAAAAFGNYEWAAARLAKYWKPDYAHAIALGVLFGVPLLVLRVVFDKVFRRACPVSSWADRAGGAVCGLVSSLVIVGVLGVAVKMVPFGVSILGYSPVVVSPQLDKRKADSKPLPSNEEADRNLLLSPDRFAVATAGVLADGIFASASSFHEYNPDLVQAVGWVSAVPAEVSRCVPSRSVTFVKSEPVELVYRLIPGETETQPPAYEQESPKGGMEFRAVRVRLEQAARDARSRFLATLRQFRLVGRQSTDSPYEQYHPVAFQDVTDPTRHIRYRKTLNQFWPVVDDVFSPLGDDRQVEVVFELPKGFNPIFLEYKRGVRIPVTFDSSAPRTGEATPATAPAERVAAAPETPAAPATAPPPATGRRPRTARPEPPPGRGGAQARGVAAGQGGSRFSDELPITLTAYRGVNAETSKGALTGGHLLAEVDQQSGGKDPPLGKFDVPPDKRLLQLSSVRLQARSALGAVLSKAITTVQNYYVEDSNGRRYTLAGKYAVATVGGQKVVEIQYFREEVGSMGGIGAFQRISERDLKPDDEFVLLFLVDPGARIVSFSSGGQTTAKDDLTAENLTAPP